MTAPPPSSFDPVAALVGRRLVAVHGAAQAGERPAPVQVATITLTLDDGSAVQVGVGYAERLGRLVFGPAPVDADPAGSWADLAGRRIDDVTVLEVLAQPPAPPAPPGEDADWLERGAYSGEEFAVWYFHDEDHPPRLVPARITLVLSGGRMVIATIHETAPALWIVVVEGDS